MMRDTSKVVNARYDFQTKATKKLVAPVLVL